MTNKIKHIISVIAFIASVTIGFIALYLPPQGVIDSSVLWWSAQMLCFVATLLGANLSIDFLKRRVDTSVSTEKQD